MIFSLSLWAESYVDSQGNLVVDGEPYFIMGLFSDSYSSSYDDKMATIDSLSKAGFNVAKTSAMGEKWQMESHLGNANNSGMKLIYDGAKNNQWKDFHLNIMKTYKDYPGLLGWYIADDSHRIHPDTLKMLYNRAKEIDPDHITTHSMALSCWNDYGAEHIRERVEYCDVLQMQSYPIGKEPIDEVYHDMRHTIEAVKPYNTPVVVDLQLFNWQLTGHEWGRWPTQKETELMTWLAIVAGVDGYLYYSYYDELEDPARSLANSQPELWKTAKNIAKKMNIIKPVLLEQQKFITFNPKSDCYYGHWITDNHSTVIVINTSKTDSLSVSIPIVEGHTKLQSLFNDSSGKFRISEGFLRGNLAPMSVDFYRLSPQATGIKTEQKPQSYNINTFPNPTNGRFQISISTNITGNLSIQIYSLQGTLVNFKKSRISNPGSYRFFFPIEDMAAGIYLIKTEIDNITKINKITYLP